MIEKLFELGLLAIVLSSFCMAFVLMVRLVIARWLGPRWAYRLWLVPLLGLMAMAIPAQPVQRVLNVQTIKVPVINEVVLRADDIIQLSGKVVATGEQAPAKFQVSWKGVVLGVWGLGSLLLITAFSIRSFRSSSSLYRQSSELSGEQKSALQPCSQWRAKDQAVTVRILSSNHGPALIGLFRQIVYLPADFFQRFSTQQQTLILKHECQHLIRHDLSALLLARLYRCLFWFNPLVYMAESCLRLDQELSVDEEVLATTDLATRQLYGETLILSCHAGSSYTDSSVAYVSYSPGFEQLKHRTQMLRHYQERTARKIMGSLVLLASLGVSVACGALGMLEVSPDILNKQASILGGKATVQFAQKNYFGAVESLLEMERLSPSSLTADSLALHSRALLKLNQWDQGLNYINRAIAQTESDGQIPKQEWLLVQTALQWKQGDSPAAAVSLERSIQFYPETTYQETLTLLNKFVQDVWMPIAGDDALVQL